MCGEMPCPVNGMCRNRSSGCSIPGDISGHFLLKENSPKAGPVPLAEKIQAMAEPRSRSGTAAEVAEKHGVSRTAPHVWRREMMGDNGGEPETKGEPVSKEYDGLPDDIEVLQDMLREAKMQPRKVQLELDVRQATLEIVKKTGAPTQSC